VQLFNKKILYRQNFPDHSRRRIASVKRQLAARQDGPLPLWMVFPLIFVAVFLSHLTLLRLPYYWDEAGYYIPAAYDFFRSGTLIPHTTLSNAHPPLPSIYLALWWKASGFLPAVTRTAISLVAACGLTAVWQLAIKLNGRPAVAAWTTLLTGLYPIWFAQSTLAHADIFAATATLWALVFALPQEGQRSWAAALFFSLAVLAKETAIVIPLSLAIFEIWQGFRRRGAKRQHFLANLLWYLFPILPIAGWYSYHYAKTGFVFGNPEYLRYNATSTLTLIRVLAAFGHRILHLTAHMNLFVPVLFTIAAMMLEPIKEADGQLRPRVSIESQVKIYWLLLANAAAFSILGGALLTRYLLPMYPLVLLLCVSTFHRRVRYWYGLTTLSAMAFIAGLFLNPPYRFAPEDNLAYRDVIRLHQQAVAQVVAHFAHAQVLTAWPMSDELSKPELGYVKTPIRTFSIENFSLSEVQKAAEEPEQYSAAAVFSTKYDPPHLPFSLGPKSEALDERYFGLHHDLTAEEIASLLHGELRWEAEQDGLWAAVLRFHRMQVAKR
jgi:Dolichyl-phosphate-mannose-protein mannosyltransferase